MLLHMRSIRKSFDTNIVLKSVDFQLESGEICALLGENGAGKSTLMNILGGVLQPDAGIILMDDKPVTFRNTKASLNAGIAFIHQELNLVNDLAIYENMFIGRELRKKSGLLNKAEMCNQCRRIFEKMGIEIDPALMVRELDASYKQIVEIARALLMNARVIIMDEPTTSLTETEIARVFAMMRTLKDNGIGIVFISHKLKEVFSIADTYTVLRDGSMVARGLVSDVTTLDLARVMVGHEVRSENLQHRRTLGETVLETRALTAEPDFRDISFAVRAGEVVGFTGLLGDGRSELFRAIFGAGHVQSGEILVHNIPRQIKSTEQALAMGIGYVPRNRKENGIVRDLSILENGTLVTLPKYRNGLLLNRRDERNAFAKEKERLHIKMGLPDEPIYSLSGGNQQKVVLAKWLTANPAVMIFDNPTQGVDVGAKEDIYDIILALADSGVAVIVLSSEAQEIIRVCDRTFILYHGNIAGHLAGAEMNETDIMHIATGGQ